MSSNADEQRLYDAIRTLMKENDALKKLLASIHEPIAIVGMACRLPGSVNSVADYWKLLTDGGDTAGPVPASRWDNTKYYDPHKSKPGKIYTKNAHFIDEYEQFDADFFSITPKELESMDPQHRLLIELTHTAFENALIPMKPYHGSNTGVFLGHFTHDYGNLITKYADDTDISAYTSIGNSASTLPGRISFLFGFQGPSFPINTACSSSLVAAHLACNSLRSGECDLAVVGGVNLMLSPEIMINICQAHMLSDDGRCHTFDQSANGYGRGEGAGIVLLKRLSDALLHKDNIEAVILASGTNQDGASSALSVPNGQAQQALLSSVLQSSGLHARDIDYIEAHGTGTVLGDPVEMNAINQVYKSSHNKQSPLYVSSVKANIGHLEAAAGVAGMIKVALLLKHKIIPPHVNLHTLNPAIHLEPVPVSIPTVLTPLDDKKEHVAAISAFGFSGSNAHMILKQAPSELEAKKGLVRTRYVTKLSAKSADSLQEMMGKVLRWLDEHPDLNWADFSYSLNIGRDDYDYRCIIVSSTLSEFREGLAQNKIMKHEKKSKEIQWTLSNLTLNYPMRDWLDSKPLLKNALESVMKTIQTALNLELSLTDFNEFSRHNKTKQAMLSLSWNYALTQYYLYLGLKPSQVIANDLALLPALAAANKIGLNDALVLTYEALRLRAEESNSYQKLVEQCILLSGDFPVVTQTVSIKAALAELPLQLSLYDQFEPVEASLIRINFNELMSQNPEVMLQSHLALAYLHGHPVLWAHYEQGFEQAKINIPNYPFNKKAYLTPILERMKSGNYELEAAAMYMSNYPAQQLAGDKIDIPGFCLLITDNQAHEHAIKEQLGNKTQLITIVYPKNDSNELSAEIKKALQLITGSMMTLYLLPLFARTSEAMKEDVLFLQQYHQIVSAHGVKQQFYYLTRNASAMGSQKIQEASAAIHGLLKAINFEYAVTDYKTIDFDDHSSLKNIAITIHQEIVHKNDETETIYRSDKRYVSRIEALVPLAATADKLELKADKSYVITGGLGGLGLVLCEHLLSLGAGRVHLLSRRTPSQTIQDKITGWNHAVLCVNTHSVDISNQAQFTTCLDTIQASDHPIAGFFHLAGTDDRAPFTEYDWPRFEKVLTAKIRGAQCLHEYSQKMQIDYFVLFSSIASSIGSARQAPYVVANAYLDALAYARRTNGLPGQSIHWGPWAEEGLINKSLLNSETKEHLLNAPQALRALDVILHNNLSDLTVVKPEFLQFLLRFFEDKSPAFLAHILQKSDELEETAIVLQLKQSVVDQYETLIEDYLLTGFKQVTNWDETTTIDVDKSFFDMGIDSLMAIELAEYCRKGFAPLFSLSPTLLFDTSSIRELVQFLSQSVAQALNQEIPIEDADLNQTYTEHDLKNMSLADIDAIIGGDDD